MSALGRTGLVGVSATPPAVPLVRRGPGPAESLMEKPGEARRAAPMVSGAALGSEPAVSGIRSSLAWTPGVSMAAELARESAVLAISTVLGPARAASGSKPRQDLGCKGKPPLRRRDEPLPVRPCER